MSEKTTTDRRSFLKLASVGAASVGAASVVATAGAQSVSADEKQPDNTTGYTETDHVKKVYELARF